MTTISNSDRPSFETMLMIDERRKMLMPLSPRALEVAQGRTATIRQSNEGVLLLYRNGTVRKLERVNVLSLYGETALAKISACLTSTRKISVELSEPLNLTIREIKEKLIALLPYEYALGEPNLDFDGPIELLTERIEKSDTCDDIFRALHIPAPRDALDVL